MNTELLNEVADAIEAADRFTLTSWFAIGGMEAWVDDNWEQLWNRCDTVACIAGWVNAVTEHDSIRDSHHAANALGLTYEQQRELFVPDCPTRARPRGALDSVWQMKDPYSANAKQAAQLLRAIASGKRKFTCDRRFTA